MNYESWKLQLNICTINKTVAETEIVVSLEYYKIIMFLSFISRFLWMLKASRKP